MIAPPCLVFSRRAELQRRIRVWLEPLTEVSPAGTAADLDLLVQQYGACVVLVDLHGRAHREVLPRLRAAGPAGVYIVLGPPHADPAREAMRLGADAVEDPAQGPDRLRQTVRLALAKLALVRRVAALETPGTPRAAPPTMTAPRRAAAASVEDLEGMLTALAHDTAEALQLARAAVFLAEDDGTAYTCHAALHCLPSTREKTWTPSHPFVTHLRLHGHALSRGRLTDLADVTERTLAERALNDLGAEAVAPLVGRDRLLGWVCAGRHRTGRATGDASVLELVAHAAGMAAMIENALLYRTAHARCAQLERAQASFWSEFSEALSHDFRNPLVALSTFAQLLPERYDDPDFRDRFRELAIDEVGRLNRMIDRISAFAEPSSLTSESLRAEAVVERATALARDRVGDKGVHPSVKVEDALAPFQGDAPQLTEGLAQVITNALEAVSGVEDGRVDVTAAAGAEGSVVFSVRDNGEGIPGQETARLFSPFCSTKARGMGLGLPMARRAARAHGGDLSVTSDNSGTCVAMQLPAGEEDDV